MPKNKASHSHDREYIIPAPLEMVIGSLEALREDDWSLTEKSATDDSFQFQLVRKLSPNRRHYVGGIGQAIRYEGTDTLLQLRHYSYRDHKANNGCKTMFLLSLGLYLCLGTIFPSLIWAIYAIGMILIVPFTIIAIMVLVVKGFSWVQRRRGYHATSDRIRVLAQIALDMLQNYHKREFSKITLVNREQPEVSHLVDNVHTSPLTEANIEERYHAQK